MKYVRWLLLVSLGLCFFKACVQQPFFKELPMLLLPEQNANFTIKRTIYNIYDEVSDPRPICIHTKNNFSHFSQRNNLEENYIVTRLNSSLLTNGATLLEDNKIIATSQKDFSPEVTTVWATKRTAPLLMREEQKAPFVPKE